MVQDTAAPQSTTQRSNNYVCIRGLIHENTPPLWMRSRDLTIYNDAEIQIKTFTELILSTIVDFLSAKTSLNILILFWDIRPCILSELIISRPIQLNHCHCRIANRRIS